MALIGQHRIRIAPSGTVARNRELAKLAQSEQAEQQTGVRAAGEEMEAGMGVDAASVLMLLSRRQQQQGRARTTTAAGLGARGRVFECKTCGRMFPTFQALGGHRASHRRPKPYPYTYPYGGEPGLRRTRLDEPREGECAPVPAGPRLHGCPICGLEFAVGQALGGHMRRHRTAAAGSECELRSGDANATSVEEADVGAGCAASGICLDLSLAPSENCAKCRNNAVLGSTVHDARKSLISECPPL